jgi:hypothetical protein
MALSTIVPGKRNSIEQSGDGGPHVVGERDGHAPVFASPRQPEPNVTQGERLQPPIARPRREATRTRADARTLGLAHTEALDLSREEVLAYEA